MPSCPIRWSCWVADRHPFLNLLNNSHHGQDRLQQLAPFLLDGQNVGSAPSCMTNVNQQQVNVTMPVRSKVKGVATLTTRRA
ncbi:hypothetical protein EJB05_53441, partial [Eragrostis curvula]